jgi:hypothetical protein
MVAPVVVIAVAATAEMTGGTAVVAKVKLPEVVDWLELFAETTSKSYVVPDARPEMVTE